MEREEAMKAEEAALRERVEKNRREAEVSGGVGWDKGLLSDLL
jgi:hypothetical protein